ncbi:MAG: 50S ribosomal protein L29 [Clostridia bacterium]|nr:50S ribosomal protein L29 [Clostridia bacterium]
MKNTEFNSLTNAELAEKLASLKAELFNLRFTHATGSLANSNEITVCKRNIARVKTVLRQRELGLVKGPEEAPKKVAKTTKKSAKVDAEKKG